MLPLITITDATPQRTLAAQIPAGSSTLTSAHSPGAQTPASSGKGTESSYRLLYRGALSLPDSYLLLDGITFSARLPNRQASALQDSPSLSHSRSESFARELMYNPLALTLESMRGRQSLQFKGTVHLRDIWTDDTGDIYMDIHPFATLTRIYFENILCLSPLVASHDLHGPKRTETGVRVSLGDTDGSETTDIVIYGETSTMLHPLLQLSPATTSASAGPPPLSIRVARITPAPRAPRPDDPTPRRPPAHSFGASTLSSLGANKRILPRPKIGKDKEKEKEKVEEQVLRQAKEVMLHLPRSKASANGNYKTKDKGVREGTIQEQSNAVFKVPELPAKTRRKQGSAGMDVFGVVELPQSVDGKGKGKATLPDRKDSEIGNAIESANKLMLKKLAVRHLSNIGIPRSHSEFKEVYGLVYRGASFALRAQMKMSHINAQAAEAIIEAHIKLYVLTPVGACDTSQSQEQTQLDSMDVDEAGG